jgi:hypothetical protein
MNAKCRVCGSELSLILSPYEKVNVQAERLYNFLCSALCAKAESSVQCAVCHTSFTSARDLEDHRLDDESECFMAAKPMEVK